MISVEDTEKMIETMRAQAKALEAGADALEASLAPIKMAMSSIEGFGSAATAMSDYWLKMMSTMAGQSTKR